MNIELMDGFLYFLPIVNWGRYREENDRLMLPEIGYHIRHDCQCRGYAKEAAAAVRSWAFQNTVYPALYSYCKYTNIPSIKTAEAIGMHFDKEYPDEANEITHVSVIYREDI